MRVLWVSANVFGYMLLKDAINENDKIKYLKANNVTPNIQPVDFIGIITLSDDASTKMYDGIETRIWNEFMIPVFRIRNINDADDIIMSLDPDVIFVCGWRQKIGNDILDIPKNGIIGFHPTLLPYGRGPAPIINSILEGINISGVTAFYMNESLDGGNIILQEPFIIEPTDYAIDVYNKAIDAGRTLVRHCIRMISTNNVFHTPQNDNDAYVFPKLTPEDNEIDIYNDDPEDIERKIRAFSYPYLGAYIDLGDKKLRIWRASMEEQSTTTR
jgi:methionyl-tRNA formyltransferase